jgi:hypothetical protein
LIADLNVLFERFPRSSIVIDDMRCMVGQNAFPTIKQILEVVPWDYVAQCG